MKKIAVLCSGGDGPGMNAALRSVVRTAIYNQMEVIGVRKGYTGLVQEDQHYLTASSVGNIIHKGGTMLKTSRCPEFMTPEGRAKAAQNLSKHNVDALVVIGGDGSFKGAKKLSEEHNINVMGIPGTIDNDILGTDYTIGHSTAVETATAAVDKIRDTAYSHSRTFLVEVMGRSSSAIGLEVALCTGAENIIFPSQDIPYEEVIKGIKRGLSRQKSSSIIIVIEDNKPGVSYKIQKELKDNYSLDAHVCILGHIQRGGTPNPKDRLTASLMGNKVIECLLKGERNQVMIERKGTIENCSIDLCLDRRKWSESERIKLIKTLSI